VTFLPVSFRVKVTSWGRLLIWASDTWPVCTALSSWLKPGRLASPELLVISFWATKARRITIRMGKAALLKNRFIRMRPSGVRDRR
jgi:hypothetical protein